MKSNELKESVKSAIDYNEEEEVQVPGAEAAGAPAPVETTPPVPSTPEEDKKLDDMMKRHEIMLREMERLKAERDEYLKHQQQLLYQQQEVIRAVTKPKEEAPAELTEEQIAEMAQSNPVQAMRVVAEQTAKKIRTETMRELEQQEQVNQTQAAFNENKRKFEENIAKVTNDNPELKDPNHELTKIYLSLESEMPYLLRIPEGPIKALEIAKTRYELAQLKAKPATPEPAVPAEEGEQDMSKVRPTTPRASQAVSGPSRGLPPTTPVTLSDSEKLAARRLRLAPEEYAKYKRNSQFSKEEAPRRKA